MEDGCCEQIDDDELNEANEYTHTNKHTCMHAC